PDGQSHAQHPRGNRNLGENSRTPRYSEPTTRNRDVLRGRYDAGREPAHSENQIPPRKEGGRGISNPATNSSTCGLASSRRGEQRGYDEHVQPININDQSMGSRIHGRHRIRTH
ncbi:glycosyltransferase protein, partial [Pyrenophora tritici-repentis]